MSTLQRIWFGHSLWFWVLLPFSLLYGIVAESRRVLYQRGWLSSWQAPVPVVVIGNLTAGGNGKTPVVIWLVEELTRRGKRVGVVSRGYGGKSHTYPLVLGPQTTADQAGDEPVLIYQRTGAPVVVAPQRVAAVQTLLRTHPEIEIVITDDGLQHYALQRTLEIVVVDGVRRFGNGWWLPAGPMREKAYRLRSTDVVITNGGTAHHGELQMVLQPGHAINLLTGEQVMARSFAGVVAMAGIGHPGRFFDTLRQLDVSIKRKIPLADHQPLDAALLSSLVEEKETLLMTEKDAVKCKSFAQRNWWYLPVDAQFSTQDQQRLLGSVLSLITTEAD